MRSSSIAACAALLFTLTACTQADAGDDSTESDTGRTASSPESAPTPATTREAVEQAMEGDPWYEGLTDEQLDLVHSGSADLCSVADEEITYGEIEDGAQSMSYTRTLVMQIGLAGALAAVNKGEEVEESARRFLMTYIGEDCPEHADAMMVILDEQRDVLFGS
ncbi:hypothetical protein [Nocardiopsis alba]|uniref:Lipoprotein n=2 Tax=Nocardiopsis alba TaxID=53437 RepID=A0ABV5DWB1_9ACTN